MEKIGINDLIEVFDSFRNTEDTDLNPVISRYAIYARKSTERSLSCQMRHWDANSAGVSIPKDRWGRLVW